MKKATVHSACNFLRMQICSQSLLEPIKYLEYFVLSGALPAEYYIVIWLVLVLEETAVATRWS